MLYFILKYACTAVKVGKKNNSNKTRKLYITTAADVLTGRENCLRQERLAQQAFLTVGDFFSLRLWGFFFVPFPLLFFSCLLCLLCVRARACVHRA